MPELQIRAIDAEPAVGARGSVVRTVNWIQMVIRFLCERSSAGIAVLEGNIGPKNQGVIRVEPAFDVEVDAVILDAGNIIAATIGHQGRI